jgi:hypothetical protein
MWRRPLSPNNPPTGATPGVGTRSNSVNKNKDVVVIEYLNVNSGLYNKMYDINKYLVGDVVGVGETNLTFENDNDYQRRNYNWFNHPRVIDFNSNYNSGNVSGVGCWMGNHLIDNNIGNHQTVHGSNDRRVWVSIGGDCRATFVCFVYAPTVKHRALVTLFWNQLVDETNYYSARGDVIVMGDMNAHIMDGSSDHPGQLMLDYMSLCSMSMMNNTERCHHDKGCNGATWQRNTTQRSTIDYVLVSCSAVDRVKHMNITWNGNAHSDHAVLRLHWYYRCNNGHSRYRDTHNNNGQQNTRKWIVKYPTKKEHWDIYERCAKPLLNEWHHDMRQCYAIDMNSYSQPHKDRVEMMDMLWTSWKLINNDCMIQSFGRRSAVIW